MAVIRGLIHILGLELRKCAFATILCATLALTGCRSTTDHPPETDRELQPVELPLPDISRLRDIQEAGNKEFLLRYLSSDSGWHVTYDWGGVVAEKRDTLGEGNFCLETKTQLDIWVLFGPSTERPAPWFREAFDAERVALVKLEAAPRSIRLPLWESPDTGQIGSCLLIAGDGIRIQIKQWHENRDRTHTRRALAYVVNELSRIMQLPAVEDTAKYWRQVLPEGSLGDKEAVTVVNEAKGFREHIVKGFVNERERGYVTVRAFDASTGKEIVTRLEPVREYVGWSKDRSVFFPFRIPVYTYEGAPDDQKVRFEVWFTPTDIERRIMVKEPS